MADLNSTERFSDRVDNYVKYRPGYPEGVFVFLAEELGMGKGAAVADVGSGTGISSEPLLKQGCRVFAVEPNREMRDAASKRLGRFFEYKSVVGTAEETTLESHSVDAVLAAQAFHWFEPVKTRQEFKRILKPGGWVVLLWNDRLEKGTAFLESYEELLQKFGTDYNRVKRQWVMASGALPKFFGERGHHVKVFQNVQKFDFQGLKGRLLSSSYSPNESNPQYAPMMVELGKIFERHAKGGLVEMLYETNIYYGRLE